ncbi:MAG: helix-turn-helix transcriptional regulator [Ruminococcus sp.]|nr:helix-turn-helix transcriptional regulator [Ruminococcus sp.]
MNIEQRLFDLRKSKNLSQEELAEKLGVTRQTISKWETGQSTPDFDKIIPLCEIYGISADELLIGKTQGKVEGIHNNTGPETDNKNSVANEQNRTKKAIGISIGVLLYFVAVAWITISVPFGGMDPVLSSGIFMLICGVATFVTVLSAILFKTGEKKTKKSPQNKMFKQISEIIALVVLVIYLVVSFLTMAWGITWIMWVVYALVMQIIRLVFSLRGVEVEE